MPPFVHEQGICESTKVGEGTRIWAFAHVLSGAVIGADCNICDHVFIENDVTVGDRVTIKSGVQLWDSIHLADDVFVGPNVTFTNDPFPRSREHLPEYPRTEIGPGASLGANATILPGVRVGRRAMVGAGAVVTKDVPPNAVVVGNPARIVGYVDGGRTAEPSVTTRGALPTSRVPGVRLQRLNTATDLRGSLVAVDFAEDLPFSPRRTFVVYDVPSKDVRGAHAHRCCAQFLTCLRGSVSCVVDDGSARQEFLLNSPDLGLYMPAMVWGTQYAYSQEAVLLVFASLEYDPDDYIRDYDAFLEALRSPDGA